MAWLTSGECKSSFGTRIFSAQPLSHDPLPFLHHSPAFGYGHNSLGMGQGLQPAACAQGMKKHFFLVTINSPKDILGPIHAPAVDVLGQPNGHGRQTGL
jgi:hypothetical protein